MSNTEITKDNQGIYHNTAKYGIYRRRGNSGTNSYLWYYGTIKKEKTRDK